MSMTKAELRTRTLQMADAVDATRWDATPNGEVDLHIGHTMDREWRRILNASPYYNLDRLTITSDTDGYYALSDLSTGSGDTAHRLYRVIAFARDSIVFEEVRVDQYLMPSLSAPQPQYIWYFEAQKIRALPIIASHVALVAINWIPTRQEQLDGEDSVITFPDGYEDVIAWSAASRLLNKSASEAARAQVLEFQAEALRQDMLQDLERRSLAPIKMRYTDSTWDYGG